MTTVDLAFYILFTCFAVSFVLYGITYTMVSLRLKREHPELWDSLGRPYPFIPPRDPQLKAAQQVFFQKGGYESVNDPVLQSQARRTKTLSAVTMFLLFLIVAIFLYRHYSSK